MEGEGFGSEQVLPISFRGGCRCWERYEDAHSLIDFDVMSQAHHQPLRLHVAEKLRPRGVFYLGHHDVWTCAMYQELS